MHLLDGWASDDTHSTCSAFEWSHGGKLHMLEGIATSTTLETRGGRIAAASGWSVCNGSPIIKNSSVRIAR